MAQTLRHSAEETAEETVIRDAEFFPRARASPQVRLLARKEPDI